MRNDLLWECINGGLPYRQFAVLCAIYCQLGSSSYRRITREQIIAAALGYKATRRMTAETLAARPDKASPLTVDQLRYTLDQLETRSLFARVQLSARRAYFSNRMAREELAEKLAEWKIKRATKIPTNRTAEQHRRRIAQLREGVTA